jgi:Domain of unknown function (DUF4349)
MSEARFEDVVRELRATAPTAPTALRERVRALPQPRTRAQLRLRPALAGAVGIAAAIALGAAMIGGLTGSDRQTVAVVERTDARLPKIPKDNAQSDDDSPRTLRSSGALPQTGKSLAPGSRLQRYETTMRLRVRDLSDATKSAIRTTRNLDGYVAGADYATGGNVGDSTLDLRVPVQRIQQAIASFSELGTILSQHISVADLQARVDTIDRKLAAAQTVIAKLEAKSSLTPLEQAQLAEAKRTLRSLHRSRAGLVQEGTYARISLQLTTRKPAAQHTQPGRFDRFWDNAGEILGKEAIAVLYALIVIGPFAILAALALLGERARRRRADHRLLEETG